MLSREQLNAHNAALRAAGLPGPHNALPVAPAVEHYPMESSEVLASGPLVPFSADFTGSSNPRLAAAAKSRLEWEQNLPPADPELLELPEETAPLTEQSIDQRLANAGTVLTGLPDDYVYGE